VERRLKGARLSNHLFALAAPSISRRIKALPPPPAVFDGSKGFDAFKMGLNDTLGDCVVAEDANFVAAMTFAAAGSPTYIPDDNIRSTYFTETDGSDSGLDLGTDLQYQSQHGLLDAKGHAHPCGIFASVSPQDWDAFVKALYYFKSLKLAVSTPDNFMNASPGCVVDATGYMGPVDHCIGAYGRDAHGNITVASWAMRFAVTPAFIAAGCGEAWVRPADPDLVNPATGKTYDGYTLADLQSEFADFSGGNPPPSPAPDPPAPPPPDPGPTPDPGPQPRPTRRAIVVARRMEEVYRLGHEAWVEAKLTQIERELGLR
jgi:hypothetical protein